MHRLPLRLQRAPFRSRGHCGGREPIDPFCSSFTPASKDTSETDVTRRGIDGFGMPRRGPIAAAVVRCAKVGATLQDFPRNPDRGLTRVIAGVLAAAARILRNATGLWRIGFVLLRPPVRR